LHQQVLQGTPVLHSAAHLADKVFRNINREPASVVPAVQSDHPIINAARWSAAR
jgi:hypothetical protein